MAGEAPEAPKRGSADRLGGSPRHPPGTTRRGAKKIGSTLRVGIVHDLRCHGAPGGAPGGLRGNPAGGPIPNPLGAPWRASWGGASE
jgi:hypothetical protein